MSNKIIFNCVYGKEDAERATLPFVAANVAAASGQEAVVVCTIEAVWLGTPGGTEVRMLDIPAATFNRAYNTVANSVLWFVHHMLYDTPNQPQFGLAFRRDWEAYREYNMAFARALAESCGEAQDVRAVVQDYHLTLAPRMLSELSPGIKIAHFSHTPWAPVEYFRLLPDAVATEVLAGILGADHAGFLCQRWADAFIDCCEHALGAECPTRGT